MVGPLEYGVRKKAVRGWRVYGIVCALPVTLFILLRPSAVSSEIRIDTGDMRICYLGIPFNYKQMEEPYRSRLLALAARSTQIPCEWRLYQRYPLPHGKLNDWKREMYRYIALWAQTDPRLATLMLEDVASYWQGRGPGFPGDLLRGSNRLYDLKDGKIVINAGWRGDPQIAEYMGAKHYVPPSTEPAPGQR